MRTTKTEFKEQLANFVSSLNATHFITFNFNRDTTKEGAFSKIDELAFRLDRKLIGKQMQKMTNLHSGFVLAFENLETNLHAHAAFSIVAGDDDKRNSTLDNAISTWQKLVPSGSMDIQTVYDGSGMAKYLTKQIDQTQMDNLYISERGWSSEK